MIAKDAGYLRNREGIQFEAENQLEKAIEAYEDAIKLNFEGNYPYDRLAIIYREQNRIDQEIRVLEHAVWVFENIVKVSRLDRMPKLTRFCERLEVAKKLI